MLSAENGKEICEKASHTPPRLFPSTANPTPPPSRSSESVYVYTCRSSWRLILDRILKLIYCLFYG